MEIVFFGLAGGLIGLLWTVFQDSFFFSFSSSQVRVNLCGIDTVPELLLRIAGVGGDRKNIAWKQMGAKEKLLIRKVMAGLEESCSLELTFLYNQNLIHVRHKTEGYFHPIDQSSKVLNSALVGKTSDGEEVVFVLHRKKGGFLRSPVLVGYLKVFLDDKVPRSMNYLFEFPEVLIRRPLFTIGHKKRYLLEEHSYADLGVDDFGDDDVVARLSYRQKKYGVCFDFDITR